MIELIIEQLFKDALEQHASDIHIEVRRQNVLVKFRINCELFVYKTLLPAEGIKLANIIYKISTHNKSAPTFNHKKYQNNFFDKIFYKKRIRASIATMPITNEGFNMIIRIFKEVPQPISLQQLGYSMQEELSILNLKINK